ncbi:LOW QUALITY PROTEIN: Dephospho-CoA kinase [Trema orientale]|uniref:Dephospho-CoA kinase n=1 Tax=Trema orientale TaxID=63057 RepID=A0A2P5EMD3_TREOI|nr:LOW QUALITY PROTEIN: Dephospho-CoA kinase [Trema orientale]
MDKWTRPINVVVDPETQLQRLMARDSSSEEEAQSRNNNQMSLNLKRSKADILIANNGLLDELNEEFRKVLFEVSRPLTWTEFWLSRQGALFVLVSIIVVFYRKIFSSHDL